MKRNRLLLLLALLITAATGAWADVTEAVQGDVNEDGVVDVADIAAIVAVMNGDADYDNADVNTNGSVDVADIAYVQNIIAGQSASNATGTAAITANAITAVNGGDNVDVVINLDYQTAKNVVGASFTLYLPDGLLLKGFDTPEAQAAGKASALKKACDLGDDGVWGEDVSNGWLTIKQKADGGLLFTFIDADDLTPFESTQSKLITIQVHAVADVQGQANIKNVSLASEDYTSLDLGNLANTNFGVNEATASSEPAGSDEFPAAPKHLIEVSGGKFVKTMKQALPYETTVGELYHAATGADLGNFLALMPLQSISSTNTSAVSVGALDGVSTPVTVNADGKATVTVNCEGGYTMTVYVNVVPPLYAYVKDGVKDADKWTASLDGTNFGALPIGGLKGDGSETVTLKYNGRLKVKSVTATSDAAPAGPKAAKDATAEDVGKVIGADGNIYDDADAATAAGTTAVALIAYVGSETGDDTYNHGLALALSDAAAGVKWEENQQNLFCLSEYSSETVLIEDMGGISNTNTLISHTSHGHTAASTARNYNVARPEASTAWFLPSGGQWDKILSYGYTNLTTTAGGFTGMTANGDYWTSTEKKKNAWYVGVNTSGHNFFWNASEFKTASKRVRPCFAF